MVEFSQSIFDRICDRIAGGESLRSICKDDDMPALSSVMRWLSNDEALQEQYARARESQADAIFEEILSIADDATNDWMEKHGEGAKGWEANGEHIQRSKLRIEARKWMAGKMKPKVYGDRQTLDVNMGVQDMPTSELVAALKEAAAGIGVALPDHIEGMGDDD